MNKDRAVPTAQGIRLREFLHLIGHLIKTVNNFKLDQSVPLTEIRYCTSNRPSHRCPRKEQPAPIFLYIYPSLKAGGTYELVQHGMGFGKRFSVELGF